MPCKPKLHIPCLGVLAVWLLLASSAVADVTGRPHDLSLTNPKGHCLNCHDLHQVNLGEGYSHNLKRANEMEVCYQCHSGPLNSIVNYTTIDPTTPDPATLYSHYDIKDEFNQTHNHFPRFGLDGEHNRCSHCHNPHGVLYNRTTLGTNGNRTTVTTRRQKLLYAGYSDASGRGGVTSTDEYCFVCHNSDPNPRYPRLSNISVGMDYRFSMATYRKMTHSTFYRGTTVNEPIPDTAFNYDDNPYGKGQDISCLTCHRPHGSPNAHILKEKDDQNFCLSCHSGSPAPAASLTMFTTSGHGKAGVALICQDCHFPHGTGQENAVKRGITDPHTQTVSLVNLSSLGMNEACFACHGAASASGRYPGKAPYNGGIHKTITSIRNHNPDDSTGDQKPGDCDNCHNPHGRDKTIHAMGVAKDEALCYKCHNETTHNTASGEDVKAFFQMNSRHDLSKVKCTSCHNAHMANRTTAAMNPYSALSHVSDNRSFCLKCHNGRMPSGVTGAQEVGREWAGNGHDMNHTLACSDCHESHGSPNAKTLNYHVRSYGGYTAGFTTGLDFTKRALCEACHRRTGTGYKGAKTIPTGAGFVSQHGQGDTTACSSCHSKKHNPRLASYTGSGAYYTVRCLDCHTQGVGNPYPEPDAQFNTPLNGADLKVYSSVHDITYNPPSTVDCTKCHGSNHETDHRATNKLADPDPANGQTNMSSIRTSTNFCLECHDATPVSIGGKSPVNVSASWSNMGHDATHAMTCADCHTYHGSLNAGLLGYKTYVQGTYSARLRPGLKFTSRAFCEVCHNRSGLGYKGRAKMIPTGTGFVSQHGQGDTTPCSNCHSNKHNPRLASYTGNSTYYKLNCLDCHTQGVGNPFPDANAQFNTPGVSGDAPTMRSIHKITYNPPGTADCTKCHGSNHETDHRATNKLKDPDPANGQTNMSSIRTNNTFCLECHDSTPVSLGGNTAPNILDTYTGAGHGSAAGGRQLCSTCHVYHGSVNDKLLREDINGQPVMGQYSGNNSSVCTACHIGVDRQTPQWSGYSVYSGSIHAFGNYTTGNMVTDGEHGRGTCANCHNPHGSREAGTNTANMLNKSGENVCYACHASGFDNFTTPGDYNNKWNRLGAALTETKQYDGARKALHVGRNSVAAGTTVDDGVESSNAFKDAESVVVVRMRGVVTRSDGNADVGVKLVDPRDPSNYVQLTFRTGPTPRRWVARYRNDGGDGSPTTVFNNESTTYHTLTLTRRKSAGQVDAKVDGTTVRSNCAFVTSGYFKVRLFCGISGNSDGTAETVNAWFDDFSVSYTDGTVPYNTTSGDDVQARFYMKSHHTVSAADQLGPDGLPGTADDSRVECVDCHDPHTITEKLMAFKEISDINGKRAAPEVADQNFCVKCHSANPPSGVKYPATGVWNKFNYISSAHGNRLFRSTVFGVYTAGIACKVCHNPHGSNQLHLQRDTFDINRDGLPDDIDGDGVLDSTNMVGFIGYSTGTRKPILVGKKDGIPSRALFTRVSSTIPVQANGNVDVELCLVCHDGSPAYDVRSDINKASHHPVEYSQQLALGGAKIECYSCHDQHRAQATNEAAGRYATTNPECNADDPRSSREPMAGDAAFCLKCHDNVPPAGISFGNKTGGHQLKNIKLSYNPGNLTDSRGYDVITSYVGHFVQATGKAMMCRDCHNQHGSNYTQMLRDNTVPGSQGYSASLPIQNMQAVALRNSDPYSGADSLPVTSVTEHCLACHSGVTTYNGNLIPLPPPPDDRGFVLQPVGLHPDLHASVTKAGNETNGHVYSNTFAMITAPGSVKENCTACHDSHSPYIYTDPAGDLMDCYQCHNMNTGIRFGDKAPVQTEFNDNPTDPNHSVSMHDILYSPHGQTTPASSNVECLKCHDQKKHMQGHVRLRKDPSQFINYDDDGMVWADPVANRTINQFCLECHDPNDTTKSSNFNRNGSHTPPRLPAGHLSAAHIANGNLLCTDCHEYHASRTTKLRRNMGEEEAFCYNCHADRTKSMDGISIKARFDSRSTLSHHKVSASEQAGLGSKVECLDCHNVHADTRTNPVVNPADKSVAVAPDDTFCISCHDSNGSPGVKFPGFATGTSSQEWDTATGRWNRYNKTTYAVAGHKAAGGLSCIRCHDPHGSDNYALLLDNVSTTGPLSVRLGVHSTARGKRREELGINQFCSACHSGSVGTYGGYASFSSSTFGHKKGIDKNCTYCHNPHGSTQPHSIRSNKALYTNVTASNFNSVYNFRSVRGFNNSTTGSPYYTFCSSPGCHRTTGNEGGTFDTLNMNYATEPGGLAVDNYSKDATVVSHHPIREGLITCTSCHKEHGTSGQNDAPDLRANYYRQSNWPAMYHNSGSGQYPAQTYVHGGYYKYAPQTGTFDQRNFFEYYKNKRPLVVQPSTPTWANDLCFGCHSRDDITGTAAGMTGASTNFKGHEAVIGGAPVSTDLSRKSRGGGTAGGDYHKFSCSECHYAHASRKEKLLRRSCMSQYKSGAEFPYYPSYYGSYGVIPYGGNVDIFNCHSYRTVASTSYGWNNNGWRDKLMSPAKTDFVRPPNKVTLRNYSAYSNLDVKLLWTRVADAPGVKAHHYCVYRSYSAIQQSKFQYATRVFKLTSSVSNGAIGSTISYTDTSGQPNSTYYYAVVAADKAGNESFLGNSLSLTTGADTIAPNRITNQNVLRPYGGNSVKVAWNDPGDNVNVVTYKVYRKTSSSGVVSPLVFADVTSVTNWKADVADTNTTGDGSPDATPYQWTDNAANPDQWYAYTVVAVDAAGRKSDVPTGNVFQANKDTSAPNRLTQTLTRSAGTNNVVVGWNDAGDNVYVIRYRVYKKASSAGAVPSLTEADINAGNYDSYVEINDTDNVSASEAYTWTDTNAAQDRWYAYAVCSFDWVGNRSVVPTGTALTLAKDTTAPNRVTQSLTRTDGTNNVVVGWNDAGDNIYVAKYRVYKRWSSSGAVASLTESDITNWVNDANNSYVEVTDTNLATSGEAYTWTDTSANPDRWYAYAVVSYDWMGNRSVVPTGTTLTLAKDATVPNRITDQNLVQDALSFNVTVSWHDRGDNLYVDHYDIHRKAGSTPITDAEIAGGTYYQYTVNDATKGAAADANNYSWVDTTASPGAYAYAVVAVDWVGNKSLVPSGTVSTLTVMDPAPLPVTSLDLTTTTGLTQIQLAWTQPASMGNDVTGYYVYRKAGAALNQSDLQNQANRINGGAMVYSLNFTDTTVAAGTSYFYAVTAVDGSSMRESALGNCPSFTVPATGGGFTAYKLINSAVQTVWSTPSYTNNLLYYKLYMRKDGGGWTSPSLLDNLLPNPGFENGALSGWTAVGTGLTAAQNTATWRSNLASARLYTTASSTNRYIETDYIPVKPSVSYTYSGYVNVPATLTGGATALRVTQFKNHTSVGDYTDTGRMAATSGWQKFTYTFTSAATANQVKARLEMDGSGTAYWDDVALTPTVAVGTSAKLDLSNRATGSYDFAVSSCFSTYSGIASYESPKSAVCTLSIADTVGPNTFTVAGALSDSSNRDSVRLAWTPPSDLNNGGSTPDGVASYRVQASYDLGATWGTVLRTQLANPNFESFTGTADDAVTDTFTGWTATNTNMYAVTDSLFDNKAVKITTTGSSPHAISAAGTTASPSVLGKTYSMSFWAKANKATAWPVSMQYLIQANGGSETVGTRTSTVTPAWRNYTTSGTFTSATQTSALAVIRPSTDTGAEVVIDGVRLQLNVNGEDATQLNDGGCFVPAQPGSPQFDDPTVLTPNTMATYRLQAVDTSGNCSATTAASAYIASRPLAISDLNVTNSTTATANNITFSASASQAGIQGYNIYAKTQGTPLTGFANATSIGYIPAGQALSLTHDQSNPYLKALAGYTYAYAVQAVDVNGTGSNISSGPSTVKTTLDKTRPDRVTDLDVKSPVGTARAILTWTTPSDNSGLGSGIGVTAYQVYQMPTSSDGTPVEVTDANVGSARFVGGKAYASSAPGTFNNYTATWYEARSVYYAVRSMDGAGNWSAVSNSMYVTCGKDSSPPTAPVITACVPAGTPEVDIYWSESTDPDDYVKGPYKDVSGYKLYRANAAFSQFTGFKCINENNIAYASVVAEHIACEASPYEDSTGTPGQTYYYALKAYDLASPANYSNISNCGVATVRQNVSDTVAPAWTGWPGGSPPLTVTQQPYPDIDLVWAWAGDQTDTGPGVIDHYEVYRSAASFTGTSDTGVQKIASVAGTKNTYIDQSGEHGATYYYGVVAVDAASTPNRSVLSNVESASVAQSPAADNSPPTKPGSLAAATGVYPFIGLTWTASTDTDSATPPNARDVRNYMLYFAPSATDITESNKNSVDVTRIMIDNSVTSYMARLTGQTGGPTWYHFALEAFDMAGNGSGLTAQVTQKLDPAPCTDTTPPSAPSGLTSLVGPSPDIELSWTASVDDGGSCATLVDHYLLYRRANPPITDSTVLSSITPVYIAGNNTSYTDSSGIPNIAYWYVLTAVDSAGNESSRSNIVTSTTAADTLAPATIADLKATAGQPGSHTIQLTWCRPSDNVGIHHYEVYRVEKSTILEDADIAEYNRVGNLVNAGICLAYDDTGVTSGHTYSYAVIAVDASGNRSTISRGQNTGDTIAAAP